ESSAVAGQSGTSGQAGAIDTTGLQPKAAELFRQYNGNRLAQLPGHQNGPKFGATLRYPHNVPPTWDPTAVNGVAVTSHAGRFFNTLITTDFTDFTNHSRMVITPDMADSWEQPDPLSFTFHLNPTVAFQDVKPLNGRPCTSEDVKY